MVVPEAVRRLVARLGEEATVRRIILFGSRARGQAQLRSDVDLAIEAPDASPHDWQRFLDLTEDADTLLPIDLVRIEEVPDELRRRILLEGRTLHWQQ
jgi:predicted nucleotidyltransferase